MKRVWQVLYVLAAITIWWNDSMIYLKFCACMFFVSLLIASFQEQQS